VIQPASPRVTSSRPLESALGLGRDDDSEAVPERTGREWIAFGTLAIFACWLPLAYAAEALKHRAFAAAFGLEASEADVRQRVAHMTSIERTGWGLVQSIPHMLALGVSAMAGGFLIGRFGAPAGRREALSAGLATAGLSVALAWRVVVEGGIGAAVAVAMPTAIAAGGALVGARLGLKRRPRDGA